MKRLLLDCDGVLADFIGPVLELVEQVTGRRHAREDVDRFDFAQALGLAHRDAREVCGAISHREGWWRRLPVLPGAQQGVATLRQVAEVYVVTSPWNSCATWHADREAWLRHHFDFPARNLVVTAAKHVCAGDVFVDDRTDTLERWQAAHPNGRAVQWRTPHNRHDGWQGAATCAWDELAEWCA